MITRVERNNHKQAAEINQNKELQNSE